MSKNLGREEEGFRIFSPHTARAAVRVAQLLNLYQFHGYVYTLLLLCAELALLASGTEERCVLMLPEC